MILKNLPKLLQHTLGVAASIILGLITVIGFIFTFIGSPFHATIALIACILFLLIVLFRIFWVTEKYLQIKTRTGFEKLSTSVKYHTRDGKFINYELKKYLQCKRTIASTHEHIYHWTGSKSPGIESETMILQQVQDADNGYKKAVFKLKEPLIYGSVFVAHIKMQLDDSDKKSEPQLEQMVLERMQLISFKVQLLYKRGNVGDAQLMRRPNNQTNLPYEFLEAIPFDKKMFSYEYNLFSPEVGYTYRLSWVR